MCQLKISKVAVSCSIKELLWNSSEGNYLWPTATTFILMKTVADLSMNTQQFEIVPHSVCT